jgi:hypothetical protein
MRQITGKIIFISFFLLFSMTFLYAASPKSITLIIQGNGSPNFVEGFKYALTVEAKAAGYQITDNLSSAKYSIRFSVEYDRTEQKSKFVVNLIKVADSSVIVTMEYFFADEEEMMLYAQLVFFLLISNLPEDVASSSAPEDDSWRDKWLYFNVSFDYSFMFLLLQETGLVGGSGIWHGDDIKHPDMVAPLDHKFVPTPGVSFGIEFQFLDFMSIEPNAQISMEQAVSDHLIYNALFSMEIKFPLKFFKSTVITPYGIAAYPLRFPEEAEIFTNYPEVIFGGGIQVAAKAWNSGALFFDVSYLYIGDIMMKNQYDKLYPNPEVIHYNYSVLGFKIGFKFGVFNRKR